MMNLNVNALWVWVWARMWVWMCSLCSDCVQCTCSICLSRPPTVRRCAPFRSTLGWLVDSLFFREHTQSPPPLNQPNPSPCGQPPRLLRYSLSWQMAKSLCPIWDDFWHRLVADSFEPRRWLCCDAYHQPWTGDGRCTGRRGRTGQPPIQLSFDGPSLVVVVLSAHWLIFLLMFAPNVRWATIRVASNFTAPAPASNSSTIPCTKSMGIAVDSCCGYSSTKPSYLANWRRLLFTPLPTAFLLSLYLLCTIYAKCLLNYLHHCLTLLQGVAQLFADTVDGIN